MSIVTDRRCDGCGEIRGGADNEWWSLTPPGWNGEDKRLDFCDPECLAKLVRSRNWRAVIEGHPPGAGSFEEGSRA